VQCMRNKRVPVIQSSNFAIGSPALLRTKQTQNTGVLGKHSVIAFDCSHFWQLAWLQPYHKGMIVHLRDDVQQHRDETDANRYAEKMCQLLCLLLSHGLIKAFQGRRIVALQLSTSMRNKTQGPYFRDRAEQPLPLSISGGNHRKLFLASLSAVLQFRSSRDFVLLALVGACLL
jgi:hypothetical protein